MGSDNKYGISTLVAWFTHMLLPSGPYSSTVCTCGNWKTLSVGKHMPKNAMVVVCGHSCGLWRLSAYGCTATLLVGISVNWNTIESQCVHVSQYALIVELYCKLWSFLIHLASRIRSRKTSILQPLPGSLLWVLKSGLLARTRTHSS